MLRQLFIAPELCWLVYYVNVKQTRAIWEESTWIEKKNPPTDWAAGKDAFLISDCCGRVQFIIGGATTVGTWSWVYVGKQAEWPIRKEQAR